MLRISLTHQCSRAVLGGDVWPFRVDRVCPHVKADSCLRARAADAPSQKSWSISPLSEYDTQQIHTEWDSINYCSYHSLSDRPQPFKWPSKLRRWLLEVSRRSARRMTCSLGASSVSRNAKHHPAKGTCLRRALAHINSTLSLQLI